MTTTYLPQKTLFINTETLVVVGGEKSFYVMLKHYGNACDLVLKQFQREQPNNNNFLHPSKKYFHWKSVILPLQIYDYLSGPERLNQSAEMVQLQ